MFECKMSLQYVPDFGRFVFAQGSGPDSPKFYTSCSYEVRASSLISPHFTSPVCAPTASSPALAAAQHVCPASATSTQQR